MISKKPATRKGKKVIPSFPSESRMLGNKTNTRIGKTFKTGNPFQGDTQGKEVAKRKMLTVKKMERMKANKGLKKAMENMKKFPKLKTKLTKKSK